MDDETLEVELSAELRSIAAMTRASHADLAAMAGLSAASVQRYLAGRRSLTVSAFVKLVEGMGQDAPQALDRALSRAKIGGDAS